MKKKGHNYSKHYRYYDSSWIWAKKQFEIEKWAILSFGLRETYIILSGFEFKGWFFISNFVLIFKTLSTRLFFSIKTGWTSFDRTPIPAKLKFCLSNRQNWHLCYDDDARWYKFERLPQYQFPLPSSVAHLPAIGSQPFQHKSSDFEESFGIVSMCDPLYVFDYQYLCAKQNLTKC